MSTAHENDPPVHSRGAPRFEQEQVREYLQAVIATVHEIALRTRARDGSSGGGRRWLLP